MAHRGLREDTLRAPGGCSSLRSGHATTRRLGLHTGVCDGAAPAAEPPCWPRSLRARGWYSPKTTDAASPPQVDDAAPVSTAWSLVVLRHGGSAFCLAQTSPDTVRLTDAQCVAETRLAHRARCADGFGLFFPAQLLALTLEVRRWKEDDSLRAATCSSYLPIFLDALCTHRHTPLPRRTIQPVQTRNKGKFRVGEGDWRGRCPRSGCL
jgi:hypothetical protein